MKKIIVTMADIDAIEVRENHCLAPRYGMNQLSFRELVVNERRVLLRCEQMLDGTYVPVLLSRLAKFCGFSEDEKKEIIAVLTKTASLLKQGFHVMIIRSMIGCACGRKSGLGYGCFDEKFSPAFDDIEVRKDFWGAESLFSLEFASALLLDIVLGDYPDELQEDNICKSWLVSCCLKEKGKELKAFVAFCV